VVLDEHKGWNSNLHGIKSYNDLPEELKCYIANIEKITGVNVAIISTSPDRKDTIFKVKI
ncbi:MAG: adenylosuccinate synthetase, partial [Bacteroidales bacterium]|nr:adenylosuccinate synthetase [Bacteroidales bacterium]